MKNYIYSKSFDIVSHFCLLVLFCFLPFVFSNALLETETTFRFITSGIILAAFFIFILARIASGADLSWPSSRNPFYKILFLLLSVWALTIFRTINKGEGIYDYLKIGIIICYFLFFLLLLRSRENGLSAVLKYINVSVLSFTLISLSQIGLQLGSRHGLKLDFLLSSSLGNKNFYAETMSLFLPLTVMAVFSLRGIWRGISLLSLAITISTIILLQTLSTWVSLLFTILFLAGFVFYLIRREYLPSAFFAKRSGFAMIIVMCLSIGTAVGALYQVNHLNLIQKRLEKINEYAHATKGYEKVDLYHTNSIAERIFLWQNAWHMFKDYPLTGAGFDNWKIYSTRYGLPFSKSAIDNSTRYMRPHNDLLLILAEGGIIGFSLFMGLFACAFLLVYRSMSRSITTLGKITLLLALSGIVIYAGIACFSLPGDRFYTQVLFFLFFAIICAEYDRTSADSRTVRRWLIALVSFISVISGMSVAYIGVKRYASEIHLIYALQAQSRHDWQKMSYHAAMAKSYFFPLDYTATPIAWYQGMAAFNSESSGIARYYFEEALRCNPYDLHVLNDLGTALQRQGDNTGALKIYDSALSMAPYFNSAYMNKAVMIYNYQDQDKAYQYLRRYPDHEDKSYQHLMSSMLTGKVHAAINDTAISRLYLKKKQGLLLMDSIATASHQSFEQLVQSDPLLKSIRQ